MWLQWSFFSLVLFPFLISSQNDIVYLDNGIIRMGIDPQRGGSIAYLSQSNVDQNIINCHDMGREVQLSFYSGPDPYNPNNLCESDWYPWPWNPIGAGDVAGNHGTVLTLENTTQYIHIITQPLQWACNYVKCNCTFEQYLSLNGSTVNVQSTLHNFRYDHTQYNGMNQELPAVYTIGTLYHLISYNESLPYQGKPTVEFYTGIPPNQQLWTPGLFKATEKWAALVNDKGWGLGVYHPDSVTFLGGFHGYTNTGGPSDDSTGYIAPVHQEILDYNINYTYNFSLILGTIEEIRNFALSHKNENLCPNYIFGKTQTRQHFSYVNCQDTGFPISSNGIRVLLTNNDPQVIAPECVWQSTDFSSLYINASYSSKLISSVAELFIQSFSDNNFSGQKVVRFTAFLDDQFHVYEIDLKNIAAGYNGTYWKLRFDPVDSGNDGGYVDIASISYVKP